MRHYTKYEWSQYSHDTVESTKREVMEEHLLKCNDCLERYLSEVKKFDSPEEIELSEDFTDQVLSKIDFYTPSVKRKTTRKTLFQYYVVAASITMLLMYGGFFQMLMEELPNFTSGIFQTTRQMENVVASGWSQRFMDATVEKINFVYTEPGRDDLND
ncbi:hypothetical protein SAMN05446037_103925 [Anaerovirgula multivorans]|uniref:Uncharacterized protein n=1 Tax=Anaerovirgula multivorans TaxID=312168 RepID=A0A239JV26_9FIRM|nr:hypothetical protein [Anaerovirgula multivorans]SNT09569.1 hypothetical protein SAMN05446037_103925 [Anaerovirgula multivorans]